MSATVSSESSEEVYTRFFPYLCKVQDIYSEWSISTFREYGSPLIMISQLQ